MTKDRYSDLRRESTLMEHRRDLDSTIADLEARSASYSRRITRAAELMAEASALLEAECDEIGATS